ncbi:DNA replication protein DnaC [Vallitalea longa]|uniref:DNA replication protein DnaC n=1 Tax=Vallitalea longa TaxID=2936439 RepID=A0A9W5YBQ1_9FIRM|nr:ATP-binding protein [Vallitalea longa]GKX30552.1 DNA replication protein DnaC [Vallitalea longa]
MDLKRSQYKLIMQNYEKKQLNIKHEINKKKTEIYKRIPLIKVLDDEIASNSVNTTYYIIEHPDEAKEKLEQLQESNFMLSGKKIRLLLDNGYPEDYLQPKYDCNLCKDTGYIGNEKCICLKQAMIDAAYEQSNIKNIIKDENFSTFSFDYYSNSIDSRFNLSPLENIRIIYGKCKKFVNNFDTDFTNIILFGQAGLGKTFLCNCIAKALLDRSHTVIYLTSFQLFKLFEDYKFNNDNDKVPEEQIESIFDCDLLIIDDLGTEFNNRFTGVELFNCLNTRLLNKKSTLISTNLSPNDWSKQYSDRIVSRIFGNYEPLKIFGSDIRLKKYQ